MWGGFVESKSAPDGGFRWLVVEEILWWGFSVWLLEPPILVPATFCWMPVKEPLLKTWLTPNELPYLDLSAYLFAWLWVNIAPPGLSARAPCPGTWPDCSFIPPVAACALLCPWCASFKPREFGLFEEPLPFAPFCVNWLWCWLGCYRVCIMASVCWLWCRRPFLAREEMGFWWGCPICDVEECVIESFEFIILIQII